ncbi:MAG: LamG domain-containing protein [Verrucomicrobiales bacterium]|nr:LamG domain-containing protein [Verrucomicrobiales bacterium]
MNFALVKRWESARGLAQSKTLTRNPGALDLALASWTAPVLWRFPLSVATAALVLIIGLVSISAAQFIVGAGHYESLQEAVDAAADAANLDAENSIHIREPVLFTRARIRIGAEFGEAKQLLIRPDPSVPDLPRVTIVSQNGLQEIMLLDGASHVTVQNLDLVRHTTNVENLMEILNGTEIVVERCRVGSDWPTASLGEWSNLVIGSPRQVVVRNCVFFARLPGNLSRGVVASVGSALNHSVFLYNNVVADYSLYGVEISAHGDAFVLLRNNVVLNHISLTPEPTAFHSLVDADVTLVTSHNTALAAGASVELIEGDAQSIAGADNFLRLERHEHIQAFQEFEWKTDLGWNQNRNLFRLIDGGLLHNIAADAGVTVTDGVPHARDVAVLDDWELDPRPSGDPSRTDRGADQFRRLTMGDIEVTLTAIAVFSGVSAGSNGADDFEIVAVGPQEDLPDLQLVMSGGEFQVSGEFVSLANRISNLRLPRGTRYDGTANAFVEFPAVISSDATPAMTVEAWVFREETNRVETILSHDRRRSFWFGFNGPRLHFQRGPGQGADADGVAPGNRWTHVAAAYDGNRVSFYIDGEEAGNAVLGEGPARQSLPLRVGGDPTGLNFLGYLDEVRLWSVARSPGDIRGSMFDELPRAPGLEAALPSGGEVDSVLGLVGQAGSGAVGQRFGIVPRSLEIPRSIWGVKFDGKVDTALEYLGGEQVAIPYDDGTEATVHLVYVDEPGDQNLYVGIAGLRDVPLGRERSNSWVAVNLDRDWSKERLANQLDIQLRAFLSGDRGEFWVGDGQGGYMKLNLVPGPLADWDVTYDIGNEFAPPSVEFRIGLVWLGRWTDTDGMMFGHFDVGAAGDNYLAPNGTAWNSPATWPSAIYVENNTVVPGARFGGNVYNHFTSNPIANHQVSVKRQSDGIELASATTDNDGEYYVITPVPLGDPLRLEVAECPGCLYLRTGISQHDTQPAETFAKYVVFPGAEPGNNLYAPVDFYLRKDVGPIVLAQLSTNRGSPRIRLRETPLKELQPDRILIRGENLHSDIQVFLSRCPLRPLEVCDEAQGHYEAPHESITLGGDENGAWIEVEVPSIPREEWVGNWTWWVKDLWERPDRVLWRSIGGTEDNPFFLGRHEYPLIDGFEFDNRPYRAWWQEFDGVYGANGWLPFCVRDPFYLLWFPIFKLLYDSTDGVCNGMSSTSLLFFHGNLDAMNNDFDTDDVQDAYYPAGLDKGRPEWRDPACAPYEPVNLIAKIRANHGVQFSAEYIETVLDQIEEGFFEGGGSISGDPVAVLNRVADDPVGYVISMVPEIGKGHVVTPYAVQEDTNRSGDRDENDSLIWIYDNNWPQEQASFARRFIEIRTEPGHERYYLPRKRDVTSEEDRWFGDGIFSIPLDVFRRPRTVPGTLLAAEALATLIAGGADGLYSSPDGEWGWREDGTVVDTLPGAKAFVPIGGPNSSTRNVMLFMPATNPPPSIQINVRGPHYYIHTTQAGRMLQLEQFDGVAGDRDDAAIVTESNLVTGLRYTPQRQAQNLRMRIGSRPSPQQRLVFEWSDLSVNAGETVGFKTLPSQLGAELINEGTTPLRPSYTVTWADVSSTQHGTRVFGPFELLPGAVQRLLVQDWPAATQLRSEIDLNRDGTTDRIDIVAGNLVPPPELSLGVQVDPISGQLVLSWPMTFDSVELQTTANLASPVAWTDISLDPEVVGQTVRVTVPPSASPQFFRLRY